MAITPTSTFSDILSVNQFQDDKHKDKALKATGSKPLYQLSSLTKQSTYKQDGAKFIKASLDREFGLNFGARVFARANTYKPGLNLDSVVKGRDLSMIDRASHNIRAEDTIGNLRAQLGTPARGITGPQIQNLLAIVSDPKVSDGTKMLAEGLLRESLSAVGSFDAMKATLTVNGKPMSPQQVDQLVNLKKGNGDFSFTLPEQGLIQEAIRPGGGGNTVGNRTQLQSQLPPGATVGVDGSITGTTTLHQFGGTFPDMTNNPTPSFVDIMDFVGQSSLQSTGSTLSNGLTIGTQAEKDLYRLNITIDDGTGGQPYSSITARNQIEQGGGDVPKDTNVSVTNAMQALGNGSANVVRVLSSVINQQFSTPFVRGLSLPNGSDFAPAVCGNRDGNQPLGTANGPVLIPPGGIGASTINITKMPNGDYQVDISYPFTLKRPTMDHDSRFAGCGDTVVQGTGNVSFTIDGGQAALGNLLLTANGPATVTWSGHMG